MIHCVVTQLRDCHEGRLAERRNVRKLILEDLLGTPGNHLRIVGLVQPRHREDCVVVSPFRVPLGVNLHRVEQPRDRLTLGRYEDYLSTFLAMPINEDPKPDGEHRVDWRLKLTAVHDQRLRQIVAQGKVVPPTTLGSIRTDFLYSVHATSL